MKMVLYFWRTMAEVGSSYHYPVWEGKH